MPAAPRLTADDDAAMLRYLGPPMDAAASDKHELAGATSSTIPKYLFTGYRKFLDPDGYPAVAPPWGTLNAIDLNTGKFIWKIPFGSYPELAAKGMGKTGSERTMVARYLRRPESCSLGRPSMTISCAPLKPQPASCFGRGDLPFAGNATPSTYMIDGRQYVVIATSGSRNQKGPQGAAYVAFALP